MHKFNVDLTGFINLLMVLLLLIKVSTIAFNTPTLMETIPKGVEFLANTTTLNI
jgi:hypothetical protein